MTKRISILSKRYPSIARTTAISFYGMVISIVGYVWNVLTTGDYSNYKIFIGTMLTTFVAWVVEWIQKSIRDSQKALSSK